MRSVSFASLALVGALFAPASASAADPTGGSDSVRTQTEDRGPNRLLLATGIATLGFTYGVSAWVGVSSSKESERWLVVPLAGPWVALTEREGCGAPPLVPCATDTAHHALLAVDGALQLAGLAQITLAFMKRERAEVERPLVMPIAIRGGAGLSATATF